MLRHPAKWNTPPDSTVKKRLLVSWAMLEGDIKVQEDWMAPRDMIAY